LGAHSTYVLSQVLTAILNGLCFPSNPGQPPPEFVRAKEDMVKAAAEFASIYMHIIQPRFAESDLDSLDHHIVEFTHFVQVYRKVSKSFFRFIKMHYLNRHELVMMIRMFGPPSLFDTQLSERLHIEAVKIWLDNTNHRGNLTKQVMANPL
jgi:hypothetical protein